MNMLKQGMTAVGSAVTAANSDEPDIEGVMENFAGLGESLAFDICS